MAMSCRLPWEVKTPERFISVPNISRRSGASSPLLRKRTTRVGAWVATAKRPTFAIAARIRCSFSAKSTVVCSSASLKTSTSPERREIQRGGGCSAPAAAVARSALAHAQLAKKRLAVFDLIEDPEQITNVDVDIAVHGRVVAEIIGNVFPDPIEVDPDQLATAVDGGGAGVAA